MPPETAISRFGVRFDFSVGAFMNLVSWRVVVVAATMVVGGFGQSAAPAPASGTAAAAAPGPVASGPSPQSAEEKTALQALATALRNPSTPPEQMDTSLRQFQFRYPHSQYKETLATLGMEFFRNHNDYARTLEYGMEALEVNPKSLPVLVSLAAIIPDRVRDTDLDRDDKLNQAESYDAQALQLADVLPAVMNGQQMTPAQLEHLKNIIRADVHTSRGKIAALRQQYPQAEAEFRLAIPLSDPESAALDYYHLAQVQEAMKQYPAAQASLDQALTGGAKNPTLQTLAKAEKERVARLAAAKP